MPPAAAQPQKKKGPRVDPARRHVNGISPWTLIKDRDPDRHYVLAGPPGSDFGPEYYQALGYEIETLRPGGPHFAAGITGKIGEAVTYRGQHVLMSCSMEDYETRREHGDGIGIGLAGYAEIMKRIRRSRPTQEITDSGLRPRDEVTVETSAQHTRVQDLENA